MKKSLSVHAQVMEANEHQAAENRTRLDEARLFSVNIMASPGAGKTSLIERTLERLAGRLQVAVVDGDIATSLDATRARAAGAEAIQINTGGACHLDAVMVRQALERLDLGRYDLLMVENVGNLICPAGFALGTHYNVLVASVPEGDDKPYKYPTMYRGVDVLIINKVDLLPYVPFDMEVFQRGVALLNPGLVTFPLSCRTGDGVDDWVNWLLDQVQTMQAEGP